MYRLLQVADNKATGNLIFNDPESAFKWLFWAGLEIVSKSVNAVTGWLDIVAEGKHKRRHTFRLVRIEKGQGEA